MHPALSPFEGADVRICVPAAYVGVSYERHCCVCPGISRNTCTHVRSLLRRWMRCSISVVCIRTEYTMHWKREILRTRPLGRPLRGHRPSPVKALPCNQRIKRALYDPRRASRHGDGGGSPLPGLIPTSPCPVRRATFLHRWLESRSSCGPMSLFGRLAPGKGGSRAGHEEKAMTWT
ncbi:hypothetical protein LX36DRAFT_43044 [Colletotrichum falcatum]|nr:hypothetical protein LX36DRAFT_43044 [Colletotrichum falcatum]